MDKNKIATVVEKYLDGTEKFLVDVEVSKGNVVEVYVDGDDGLSINECAKISRYIVSNFDRDQEDFELRVSSPGLDKPFRLRRQYQKYIDREIMVVLTDESKLKGRLLKLSGEMLVMECLADKKKKEIVIRELLFSDIKEGKPVISFK